MESTLNRRDIEIIQYLIAKHSQENPPPIARDAVLIGGSWNPQDGTAQAIFGDTAAITGSDGDQFAYWTAPVATTHLGDQYGPVGNERVVLIPTQSGYVKLFIHGPDDSPQAPAGERWITHRNSSGTPDSYTKYTNDGPTAGDAKGSIHHNGGALNLSTTTGGHSARMDDTAKKITVQSSGGHTVTWDDVAKTLTVKSSLGHSVTLNDQSNQILVETKGGLQHLLDDANNRIQHIAGTVTTTLDKTNSKLSHVIGSVQTIVDGAGNAISHVATRVGVGDLVSNLDATHAALNNSHLTSFESDLYSKRLDDLQKFASAMIAAGVTNAGGVMAQLATLVHTTVPAGSAVAFIK